MKKDRKNPTENNDAGQETAAEQIVDEQPVDEQIVDEAAEVSGDTSDEAKQLQELQKKYDEQHELLLRTAAEYENFRKRSAIEKQNAYTLAKSDAIEQLLPIADTLERALAVETQSIEDFKKGMELTLSQLGSAFEKLGVEKIPAEKGEKFDPELHNAVMHVEDENLEQNVIAQCFQTGYRIGDKVIRHSMVQVAN
ncbi:MAG: nucleotide exchange factor GrpE [Clostridia bacterium]|nr:nucleotide exchange factor GrpE [Clostridia bacterium]